MRFVAWVFAAVFLVVSFTHDDPMKREAFRLTFWILICTTWILFAIAKLKKEASE